MPIASAVVVPVKPQAGEALAARLQTLEGVEAGGVGPRGVAVVMERKTVDELKRLSEAISAWEEVADFQLAYFNWEDLLEPESDKR